jgi:hypothetical protein
MEILHWPEEMARRAKGEAAAGDAEAPAQGAAREAA